MAGARSADLRRLAVLAGFVAWVAACVILAAYLLSAHLLTLPAPSSDDLALQRAIAAQRRPAQRGRWLVVHVLDEQCKCSLQVLDHLLAGDRPRDVVERVVLIAATVEPGRLRAIRARGFDLDIVTPDELNERYGVAVAPLLVVVDPGDIVRYVGGYGQRKQAAELRDAAVIASLRAGIPVPALPTFGCAVGRRLQATIDPLGLRGWK